ncbi:MAG: glycosyltransferase family 2 protein [Alphaproteobacteria bacterium]|nr:glycosyltransferase family 2 protein [Alphaproteobacteria bacterium]
MSDSLVTEPVGIELSVIIPTFNEVANVGELVRRLETLLRGVEWEAIFVDDDSPDGTAAEVRRLARRNPRVRCLQRLGRRGLSSACIEGFLATSAPYLAVMDADLQHDEALLVPMLEVLRGEPVDIVVGSRYVGGGGIGDWDQRRARMSEFATKLSQLVLHAEVDDPMSGFFMVRREAMERAMHNLSGIGFKILLDLFASSPEPLRFRELPYEFRARQAGETKLDTQVMLDYLMLLADKLIGHVVPVRFFLFTLVGSVGVAVHLLTLTLIYRELGYDFVTGQVMGTVLAMASNFLLNNYTTYRDRRLKGWGLVRGFLSFTLACSVGVVANVGIAAHLFNDSTEWLLSGLAGVIVGAVWNFALTAFYTWKA